MYDINTVTEELFSLVGFEEEDGYNLDSDLLTGLPLNNQHPLLSLQTLDSSRPENIQLSKFLKNTIKSAINKTIQDVLAKKYANQITKEVLGETAFFESTPSTKNVEVTNARFVGWVFRPSKFRMLNNIIKKVALHFTEATPITLYVYHSSKVQPTQTINLEYTQPKSVQWLDLPTPININYSAIDEGGYYLIGYYENDLENESRAIYRNNYLNKRPCGSCGRVEQINSMLYNQWSSYVSVGTGFVSEQYLEGTDNPPVERIQMTNDRNYGLNFKFKSSCDITSFIIENKELFTMPVLYRSMMELIRYIEMSPTRNNRVTDDIRKEAFVAIQGQVTENNYIRVKGIRHEYDDYIKGLDFNMSRLEPVCLPDNRKGIRWNSSKTSIYS